MRGALYHERLVGAVQQRVNLVALACLGKPVSGETTFGCLSISHYYKQ